MSKLCQQPQPCGLPEYIKVCGVCEGAGEYSQTYTSGCGAGQFRMVGHCEYCGGQWHTKGTGYVYKATGMAAPQSVLNQIRNTCVGAGRL